MQFIITFSAIVILAAFLACGAAVPSSNLKAKNEQSSHSDISSSSTTSSQSELNTITANDDDVKRISLEDAKTAFDGGDAVFVDTRSAESYRTEHIKGAVSIPLAEFEKRYKELPDDKSIIVYCS